MTNIKLSKRLSVIASFVPEHAVIADIGCDHALLDIYLSKKKIIKWKQIIPIMIFGTLGTIVSSWTVNFINVDFLRKIFGGLIASLGIYEIIKKKKKGS